MTDTNETPDTDHLNDPPLQKDATLVAIFESLLKQPHGLIQTIRKTDGPPALITKLLLISAGGFLIFGLILGNFSFYEQLWAAPLKTILGIFFSAAICLPSLYIFTALTGTSLKLQEIVTGLGAALALMAALLLGFTPVLWVFSQSSNSEIFFGLLVLLAWLIAFFFGSGILLKMLLHTGTSKKGPLRIWIGIFLLVTLQMSTTLRPIIGKSDTFFTTEKRFFLEHWMKQLSKAAKID